MDRLSRPPFWLPYFLFGPAALFLALGGRELGMGMGALWFGIGILGWTLIEYGMHRFVLHWAGKPAGAHGRHHEAPKDLGYIAAPLYISVPVYGAIVAGLRLEWGGWIETGWIAAGVAAGYLAYEAIHYRSHHRPARTRLGRYWKRYHLLHHYRQEDRSFGVTSPLWDIVFGTRSGPEIPKVAKRTEAA